MDVRCVSRRLDREKRPEIVNLLTLMSAATGESLEKVYEQYKVIVASEGDV